MKHFGKLLLGACTVLTLTCTPAQMLAQSLSPSTQWEWNKGTIVIKTPERPAGQECALGLTVPKMNVLKDARNSFRKLVCPKLPSIQVQKATKHSANAMTSTWYTLQPTGTITSLLPNMPWNMVRT